MGSGVSAAGAGATAASSLRAASSALHWAILALSQQPESRSAIAAEATQ
jgi:hypothetical protein